MRSLLGEDAEIAIRHDSLEHAIEDAVAAARATPLVILDQFEEHFLYEPRDEEGFDDELASCVNRRDLPVHFLISVREDAYSLIGDRFKARIPNVYGNYLHLEFLDEHAARAAVLEPVDVFNEELPEGAPRFSVEPELVDAVLEQVRRGRVTIGDDGGREVSAAGPSPVETAYLQLVMKRLWDEEVATESRQLRVQTLRRLGGADTIVRSHLDDVLAGLPGDQQDSTAAAFRYLVTSSGRKIALSTDELREFSDTPTRSLEPALEHLERERILRPVPSADPGGVSRREIYHDVLAPAILDWRRRHVEKRRREETERGLKQARERARRLEVRNGRLAAAVIGLAAVSVALALYLWNPEPVQKLELKTVDARFSVRGARSGRSQRRHCRGGRQDREALRPRRRAAAGGLRLAIESAGCGGPRCDRRERSLQRQADAASRRSRAARGYSRHPRPPRAHVRRVHSRERTGSEPRYSPTSWDGLGRSLRRG